MIKIPLEIRQAVYAKAEAEFGRPMQCTVAIEELSEAQKEVCKLLRGKPDLHHLAEEVADVLIMMEQLQFLFGLEEEVEMFMDKKVRRLADRLGLAIHSYADWLRGGAGG